MNAIDLTALPRTYLLDEIQTAAALSVKHQTLQVWRSTGRYDLKYVKIGRSVRYAVGDLLDFMQSRTHAGHAHAPAGANHEPVRPALGVERQNHAVRQAGAPGPGRPRRRHRPLLAVPGASVGHDGAIGKNRCPPARQHGTGGDTHPANRRRQDDIHLPPAHRYRRIGRPGAPSCRRPWGVTTTPQGGHPDTPGATGCHPWDDKCGIAYKEEPPTEHAPRAEGKTLVHPPGIDPEAAVRLLESVAPGEKQTILDTLAVELRQGGIRRPIAFLDALIRSHKAGTLDTTAALAERKRRETPRIPPPRPVTTDDVLASHARLLGLSMEDYRLRLNAPSGPGLAFGRRSPSVTPTRNEKGLHRCRP